MDMGSSTGEQEAGTSGKVTELGNDVKKLFMKMTDF